jgi:hypothetical protein
VTLDETLLEVWRQALVEGAASVVLEERRFAVRSTAKRRLKEVDFEHEGRRLRGIEQNPDTQSRWAQMSRKGAKIMQFTEFSESVTQPRGKFFANVADGKLTLYR